MAQVVQYLSSDHYHQKMKEGREEGRKEEEREQRKGGRDKKRKNRA
jgi:hypothetical protein